MPLGSPRTRRLLLGMVLGVGLLAIFFRNLDARAILAAFRDADPWYVIGGGGGHDRDISRPRLALGLSAAPAGPRAAHAPVLDHERGLRDRARGPPRGRGGAPYLVARHYGLSTSAAFASIILERLFDLIVVLALFASYLYVFPAPAAQQAGALDGALQTGGALAGLGAAGALATLCWLTWKREGALAFFDRVFARLPRKVGGALSRALHSFTLGLGVLRASPGHLAAIAAQSVLVWLLIALGLHWNNRAFGLELPFRSAFLMLGFLTVGVAVPTPGMVGGFHLAYQVALTSVFGVSETTAVAAALSSHALTNLPVLVLGLVFLGREGLSWGGVARLAEEPPATTPEPARSL